MSTPRTTITFAELLQLGAKQPPTPASTPPPSNLPPPIYSLDLDGHPAADWLPGFLLQGSFEGGQFLRDEEEVLDLIQDFGRANRCKRWTATVHPSVINKLPPTLRSRASAASPASPVDHLWITWADFAQGRWRPDTVR